MAELYQPLDLPAPLRERVYETLEELILDGRLQFGQRLVESELASSLGISRGPIREALQHLERDGWLEVRPRQGTYVRIPKKQELEDYFWARSLLEVEVAARAARRAVTERPAVENDLARLQTLHRAGVVLSHGLPAAGDTDLDEEQLERRRRYRANSRQFHYAIARLSGSQALVDLLEYLGKRTRWYFSSLPYTSRLHEHAAILDAIEQGDETLSIDLMVAHLEGMSSISQRILHSSS